MNFLRLVGPVLLATWMADWLSIMSGVGAFGSMCTSWIRRRIHVVCFAEEVAAIYSASQVDSVVIFCLRDPQQIGVPLYVCRVPDMDFRSTISAAKSASAYDTRRFWGCSWVASVVPTRNVRPVVGVNLRYLIRCLSAIQCRL